MFAKNPVQITMRATRYPQTSVSTSPKRYASGKMTIAAGTENGPTSAIFTARMLEATSVATNSDEIASSSGLGPRVGTGCDHVEPHSVEDLAVSRRGLVALRGDVRDLGDPVPAHQGCAARASGRSTSSSSGSRSARCCSCRSRSPASRSGPMLGAGAGSSRTRSSRWGSRGCSSPTRSCASRARCRVCSCPPCRSSVSSSAC